MVRAQNVFARASCSTKLRRTWMSVVQVRTPASAQGRARLRRTSVTHGWPKPAAHWRVALAERADPASPHCRRGLPWLTVNLNSVTGGLLGHYRLAQGRRPVRTSAGGVSHRYTSHLTTQGPEGRHSLPRLKPHAFSQSTNQSNTYSGSYSTSCFSNNPRYSSSKDCERRCSIWLWIY